MGRNRPPYPPEFRRRMVDLVRSGRKPEELSREFEPSAQAIRNWLRQADLDQGRRHDGLTSDEKAELIRLRREVKILREERTILSKAAAWFAKETGTIPSGSPTGTASAVFSAATVGTRPAPPTKVTLPSVNVDALITLADSPPVSSAVSTLANVSAASLPITRLVLVNPLPVAEF